ncbi:hypothetical protein JCM18750_32070 [Halostagnicola bangensis]
MSRITREILRAKYAMRYKALAPTPTETVSIDPKRIDYSLGSRHVPEGSPQFGVLSGDWDLQKTHWREGNSSWEELRERFEAGKAWEETEYYRTAVRKLRSGQSLGRLDGPQTVDNFRTYLEELDALYENVAANGYDDSSVITVSIGRRGEWMVNHGNHRRTVARLLDVESVPVRIRYRHRRWQHIREQFYRTDSLDSLNVPERYIDHPDIPRDEPKIGDKVEVE